MSLIPIDEVVHVPDVTTHDPATGAVVDADSAPTYDVFEEATDTPILDDQTMTKRTSLTGNYRGSFTASAANGFEAGKWYNVVATAIVDGVTAKKTLLHFRVAPAESVAGVPKIDVSHYGGTAGTFSSGRPEVNTTHAAGTAWGSGAITAAAIATGAIDADAIADGAIDAGAIASDAITNAKIADGAISAGKLASDTITAAKIAADAITDAKVASDVTIASVTGSVGSVTGAVGSVTGNVGGNVAGSVASVTGNVGGNVTGSVGSVASGGITAASIADGAIDRATFAADTGLQTLRSNTAQAGANGSITLDASASAVDDFYKNALVILTGGTGVGQSRTISGYTGSSKVATITPNWGTNPDNTSTFAVQAAGAVAGASAPTAGEVADAVWDEARAGHVSAGSFGQGVASVQGNVTGSVASVTAGVSLADDAITAAKFDESTAFPVKSADTGSTQIARVGADGDTLETLSDQLDTKASQSSVDDVPTNAELATALAAADDAVLAAIAALNNLSAAQVNAQVVDALAVDTYAEPSAPPAATATLAAKIGWLAILARNTIQQTATTQTLKADNGSTTVATAAVSDDAVTFERSEWQ